MNVLVLGAGDVGSSIAEMLCENGHSVTVIDNDSDKTRSINETLDVRTLTGSACQASVLFQANVADVDVCLAVTGVDEVNLIAASIAKSMGAQRVMARVFAPIFHDNSTIDYRQHFGVDRLLSLEYLSATEFARAIRNPASVTVESLAGGEIEMQEVLIDRVGAMTDKPLFELKLDGVRVGLISRNEKTWIASAQDELQVGDLISVVGTPKKIDEVIKSVQGKRPPKKTVVISGGGETGYHLAKLLDSNSFAVKILEIDPDRCEFLARQLKHVTVIQADSTRRLVLEEERVGQTDVSVSCLSNDEECIMVGVEAKELGTKRVMSLIDRPDYANVVGKLGIDVAISPRHVTAKQVLRFMNQGAILSRADVKKGEIEFVEIEVGENATVCEVTLAELTVPATCLIVALTRDEYSRLPKGSDTLQAGDAILALIYKRNENEISKLFQARG